MRASAACLILAAGLASCSSSIDRGRMRRELASPDPQLSSRTVEEVEETRSQLKVPFRLAVAPPIWLALDPPICRTDLQWSPKERAELQSWGPELVEMGLVSELVILTSIAGEIGAEKKAGWFEQLHAAAERHQADAVLIIRDVDDTSSWLNLLSLLDLTFVACWFVPGHSAEAVCLVQALVLDNRNGNLFASAEGEGSFRKTLPYAYTGSPDYRQEARLAALRDLKESLFARARTEMAELHP